MRSLPALPLLFAALTCCSAPAGAQPLLLLNRMRMADANLLGEQPVVRAPWQDLTTRRVDEGWLFRLTIDEQGRVAKAVVIEGPVQRREQAMALAKALRFKPVLRDGRAEAVELEYVVPLQVEDYVGPPDRAFPLAKLKPTDIRIALNRSGCYGECPAYWLEVRGDGWVTYRGFADTLVEGEHRWRVEPAAVAALLERFKQADYFKLQGYYMAEVSDLPTYITRLSLGQQQKFVLDYGAGEFDDVAVSTASGGLVPSMPRAVTELEQAIDAVAGVDSWVRGDAGTMAALRKANWNFRSEAAGRGLGVLVRRCNAALAADFVRAGTPVNVKSGMSDSRPVVAAAYCGDASLVRLLERRGALARKADAREFLKASVRLGYPELVAIALKHDADVRRPDAEGKLLLAEAAGAGERDVRLPAAATFDPARVIQQLLAAGSDPNARDRDGNTALHNASSAPAARALLRGGADPNARNARGETPLFSAFADDAKAVLVEAGADINARDHGGRTALFNQRWADNAGALLRVGANPNAKDNHGDTPLETADSEAIVLMLMAAGATLPTDPARLAALSDKASKGEWKQLLLMLAQALAAGEGASPPK